MWLSRTPGCWLCKKSQAAGKRESVSAEGQPEAVPQIQSHPITSTRKQRHSKQKKTFKRTRDPCSQKTLTPENTSHTTPLIGRKSLLKCFISGYAATVLFDSGSQVSIIDRSWRETFIPSHPVRPLEELLDPGESLDLYAANGQSIPYDGWVELTINLPGNDNPNLAIQVPFLVSQLPLPQPLLGSNVLDEMINGPRSSADTCAMVISLLRKALGMEEDQAKAMVNFIQVQKTSNDSVATIRVGREDVSIPAGKTVHVRCRVPPTFDTSDPVVLYEPSEESTTLEQLSVREGLLEISNSRWPLVNVPISNHTKHEIILPKRTQLGSIQYVAKVIEMGKTEAQQGEMPQAPTVRAEVNNVTTPVTPPRLSLGDHLLT